MEILFCHLLSYTRAAEKVNRTETGRGLSTHGGREKTRKGKKKAQKKKKKKLNQSGSARSIAAASSASAASSRSALPAHARLVRRYPHTLDAPGLRARARA